MSKTMALNIMRSTSLKAQKSPPSSPRQKKIVRFADSLGLDLAAVKMIMQEDLPSIPDSAFVHLDIPKEWIPHEVLIKSTTTSPFPSSTPFTPASSCAISTTTNGYKPFISGYHVLNRGRNGFESPSGSPTRNGWSSPRRSNSPSGAVNGFNGRGSQSVDDLNVASPLSSSPVVQSKLVHDTETGTIANGMNGDHNGPVNGTESESKRSTRVNGRGLNGSNTSLNRIEEPMSSVKSMPPWLQLYQSTTRSTLIPEFVEPFIQVNFLDRVRSQNVCLENCYISTSGVSGTISVTCCVRLVNRGYEKQVYVRYTTNNWSTFTDVVATYIPRSSDGWSDRFTATFGVKNLSAGQKVYVAVKYVANGTEEFWDNNNGNNYSFMHRI